MKNYKLIFKSFFLVIIAFNFIILINNPDNKDVLLAEIKMLSASANDEEIEERNYDVGCVECSQPGTVMFFCVMGQSYGCGFMSGDCQGGLC